MDGFICAIGTGGTIAGVATYLREKKKDIVIGVADPKGAAMYNLFAHGEAKASEGGSITEGIGLGRVTRIIEDIKVDKPYLIPDEEAVPVIFDLLEHEGLCMGGSTGINVAGAIRLARDMGPGHTIVTILADFGTRYQSKLFNPEFLRAKRLPVPRLARATDERAGAVRKDLIDSNHLMIWPCRPIACFARTATCKECSATVVGLTDAGGIVLDRTVFYAASGGQPGRPRRADDRDRRRRSRSRTRALPMPARPRSRICRRPPPA